ncbi:MAG TPA: hypothetical protein VHB79_25315 [Polyangiaceae bacterium]|nr:hypothetical protein [Polyangiaceae bacterium]
MADAIGEQRRRLFQAEISRVVPGLYGWLATVATPVFQRGASTSSRVMAGLALASLAASYVLAGSRPRLARVCGVHAFLLFCFGAWALLGPLLRSDQLDAVRGALGAVGFLLHALAWGAPPKDPDDTDALDNLVPGLPLQPRNKPDRWGAVMLALVIPVALTPVALAFAVERPGASLLAHAVAIGCGLLLVGAGNEVALQAGKPRRFPAWRARAGRVLWTLAALAVLVVGGLLWLALR